MLATSSITPCLFLQGLTHSKAMESPATEIISRIIIPCMLKAGDNPEVYPFLITSIMQFTPFNVFSLGVLGLWFAWRFWRFTVQPRFHPQEPKELPYAIPCKFLALCNIPSGESSLMFQKVIGQYSPWARAHARTERIYKLRAKTLKGISGGSSTMPTNSSATRGVWQET